MSVGSLQCLCVWEGSARVGLARGCAFGELVWKQQVAWGMAPVGLKSTSPEAGLEQWEPTGGECRGTLGRKVFRTCHVTECGAGGERTGLTELSGHSAAWTRRGQEASRGCCPQRKPVRLVSG